MKSVSLSRCIMAGHNIHALHASLDLPGDDPDEFKAWALQVKSCLEEYRFESALAVGSKVWNVVDALDRNPSLAGRQMIFNLNRSRLFHVVDSIHRAVHSEAVKRQMAELKTTNVSKKLRELPKCIPKLTESQKHLLDETIRCLECEAYRSAAVMGWNLAYDIIRQWIIKRKIRLAAFNAELTKSGKHTAIAKYEDFYEQPNWVSEQTVLICCHDAGLFGKKPYGDKVFRNMSHYLRERNQYAHPNDTTPTLHTTNAYIDNLINAIMVSPFRK